MNTFTDANHRRFKDDLYAEFARVGHALASPKRLEMLDLLAQRAWTVDELAREMHLSTANASQHLQVLLRARLVESRREGTRAYYRLSGDDVYRAWKAVRDLAESRLAEVQAVVTRYLGERHEVAAVNPAKLLRQVRAGEVILLDVRPVEEYRAGHIPGAQPVPLADLRRLLARLPKTRDILVYCRGPYCVFADEAVALLRRHGFKSRRLRVGVPDWKALGYDIRQEGPS
jgi:rhodanese-related sulfurtransferase